MASRNEKSEAPLTDVAKLSKVQKLGALLVILGPDSATQILKHLEDYEVEAVSAEMSKFAMITQEMQDAILKEFSEVAVEAGTAILGGVDFTRGVLEKAVGLLGVGHLSRVSPTRAPVAAMQQIVDMDARQIFNLIRHEQAQTIALVTSYLATEKASQLMGLPALTSASR
jgi:flagellar motor switch protein FliG